MIAKNIEVAFNPHDVTGSARTRFELLDGIHRRVTVHRTGEVEEIAVEGHWWNDEFGEPREQRLGLLSRAIVRELNRLHAARHFAARINRLRRALFRNCEILELFIDLAIDESPIRREKVRR